MNTQDGGLYYVPRIDIEKLRADVEKMKRQFESVNKKAREETSKTQQTIDTMLKGAMAYLTIQQAKNFASEVINIRGQFQQLGVAFETMLGNKAKADKLMADAVDFAAKTPFQLTEVARGTKQLLAYKLSAEEVLPTLKALGDVSAGLSVPIERLILNYGQVKTASKLTGRELRDFNMAGVPLISELAKNLNKSETAIQDMVSAGKIGFKDVENAFKTMTNEGGHFANLMDKQSATITGKISNLYDVIDEKLNEIGTSSEGVINASIDSASYLVENYQAMAREIGGLVVSYGAYRGALITTVAVQKAVTKAGVYDIATKKLQRIATLKAIVAQNKLNVVMMANPYAIVAVGVATLTYALYKHITAQSEAEQVQEALNNRIKEQSELAEKERGTLNSLIGTIKDETTTRFQKQQALENLQKQFPDIFKNMDIEAVKIANITDLLKEYNKQRGVKNALSDEDQLKKNKDIIDKIQKGDVISSYGSREIKKLEIENIALEKKIAQRKQTEENARFSGLSDADKIKELEAKNEELNKSLDNDNPASLTKGLINDQIQKNNKLIAGYKKNIETAKNVVLTSVSSLRKAIAKENEKIKELRTKGKNGGLTETEDTKLKEAIATKKQLEDKLNNTYIGKKPSKTTKKQTFDQVKYALQNKRTLEDLEHQKQQAIIDAMEDGAEKQHEQLKEDAKRKLQLLNRAKEDEIQRIKDAEKQKKEAQGKSYDATQGESQIKQVESVFADIEKEQIKQNELNQQEYFKSVLDKYKTYEEQKTAIIKRHNAERKTLEENNSDGKYTKNINLLEKALTKELFELEKASKGVKTVISKLFSDTSKMTTQEMRNLIEEAEKLYNDTPKTDKNVEKLQAIREQIDKLKKTVEETETGFQRMDRNIEKIFKKGTSNQELQKALQELSSDLQNAGKLANMFGDSLRAIGDISGDELFGDIADGISSIVDITNDTMSGAVTGAMLGGPTGAIIGASLGFVSSILGKIGESEKKHREALRRIRQSQIKEQQVYNQLLFEQKMLMEDDESIFGVDALSKALGYLEAYNQSFNQLQDKLKKKQHTKSFFGVSIKTNSFQNELDKIKVKTGHRKTGLFGWGRGRDIYTSITKLHKDLITKEGKLNVLRAEAILRTRQMRDEDKMRLEGIIQLYKQQEEAQEQFNSYLKETFGDLGNGMVDSIVNSLKTGEDAFKSFSKNVGNVIGSLGKQLIQELFISAKFKQLQKDIDSIYKDKSNTVYKKGSGFLGMFKEKDEKATMKNITSKIRGAVGSFAKGVKGDISLMKDFAKTWQEETKEMGFDIWGAEKEKSRKAVSKGFASMTQDQASDLNGKFTLSTELQKHHLEVAKGIGASVKTLQENSARQLRHLAGIETNTARLQKIETDISSMKSGIDDINDKGIKMRR